LAHPIWLKNIPNADKRKKINTAWKPKTQNEEFKSTIKNILHLIAEGKTREAKEKIESASILKQERKNISTEEHTFDRRVFTEAIKEDTFLWTEEVFAIYQNLVQQEIIAYKNKTREESEEIIWENGQDILSFLKHFLNDKAKISIAQSLIKTFKTLNISTNKESLNFSKEDQTLIGILSLVEQSGATLKQIETLKRYSQEKKDAEKFVFNNTITKKPGVSQTTESQKGKIPTAENLKKSLEEINFTVKNLPVLTLSEVGAVSEFEATKKNITIKGKFYHQPQIFNPLQINEKNISGISFALLKKVVETEKEEIKKALEAKENTEKKETKNIPQNTPDALLKKAYIQNIFAKEKVEIKRSNIKIKNEELSEFEITQAKYETNMLNFEYNETTNFIFNLTIHTGAKKQLFKNTLIPKEQLQIIIKEFTKKEEKTQ